MLQAISCTKTIYYNMKENFSSLYDQVGYHESDIR